MLLATTDFVSGKYRISQNPDDVTDLTAYIAKYEPYYLINLLGVTLYNLFIANLTAGVLPFQTVPGIYNTLYQPFAEDNQNSGYTFESLSGEVFPSVEGGSLYNEQKIVRSEGIKEMLKGFIFFEYTKDQPIVNTPTGNVESQSENASKVKALQAGIKEKFNEAVHSYQAIQWYINQNLTDYPDYNGVSMDIIPDYA